MCPLSEAHTRTLLTRGLDCCLNAMRYGLGDTGLIHFIVQRANVSLLCLCFSLTLFEMRLALHILSLLLWPILYVHHVFSL